MRQRRLDAETGGFYKQLFAIVFPVAGQSFLSALVSASDALMLGFLDQASLSAVFLASQVQFFISLFQNAVALGASILAAQYWGAGNRDLVEQVLGLALRVSAGASAIFFLAALLFPGALMICFTGDAELIALGVPYLRIVSFCYLSMSVSQLYLAIMKNSGRVTRSSIYASIPVVTNVLLNFVLIFGLLGLPRMGITGAALATLLSRLLELVLCFAENRRPGVVKMRLHCILHADGALWKKLWHTMLPTLCNCVVWGGGFTMFSVILGHMGSDAVAANSIANIVKNLIVCFCTGVASGTAIILGNLMGAGKLAEAERASKRLITASLIFGAASGLLILALRPLVLHFSGSLTDQARDYLGSMLYISSYYTIGRSLNGVLINGIFCSGGDTRFGFWCDLINMWVFIIPISALAAFVLHAPVMIVYFLLNLDEIGKIPFELMHYRKKKWLKNLTIEGKENGGS